MKKKKILVVDFNGTSSIYTHYLSNGLKDVDIDVYILGKIKHEFLDVFKELNRYIGFKTGIKLLDYILNWFWLLLNYKKFDGIIIQWLQLLRYCSFEIDLVTFLQNRIPIVYIVHNVYPHNTKNHHIKKRYDLLYTKVKNIAVQTTEVFEIIRKINFKSNLINIQHGLFFKEFRINTNKLNTGKCLLVGYISKYKGVEDAIEIAKILKEKQIDFSLEVIGHGDSDYIKILNDRILSYNLLDRVKIHPKEVSTKYLIDKINDASMLWLPYKEISQSGVAYTSIGLGVPMVAYDVGNFREAFGNGLVSELAKKNDWIKFSESVEKVLIENNFYKKNIEEMFYSDLWETNKILTKELFKNDK